MRRVQVAVGRPARGDAAGEHPGVVAGAVHRDPRRPRPARTRSRAASVADGQLSGVRRSSSPSPAACSTSRTTSRWRGVPRGSRSRSRAARREPGTGPQRRDGLERLQRAARVDQASRIPDPRAARCRRDRARRPRRCAPTRGSRCARRPPAGRIRPRRAVRSRLETEVGEVERGEVRVARGLDDLAGAGRRSTTTATRGDLGADLLERGRSPSAASRRWSRCPRPRSRACRRRPGPRPACRGRGPSAPCARRRRRVARRARRPGAGSRSRSGRRPWSGRRRRRRRAPRR